MKTKVRDVNQSIDNAYLAIDELGKDFNNNIKDLQLDYQNQFDDVYRLIDSRFDKFENKINKK